MNLGCIGVCVGVTVCVCDRVCVCARLGRRVRVVCVCACVVCGKHSCVARFDYKSRVVV